MLQKFPGQRKPIFIDNADHDYIIDEIDHGYNIEYEIKIQNDGK